MVEQPAKGFRIAIDTVLLAAAVPAISGERVLDMGCGVGGAMLCLAARIPDVEIDGVEIQHALAALCHDNIQRNDRTSRLRVFRQDALAFINGKTAADAPYDHIMINPPYHDTARHDVSDNDQRRIANSADADDLRQWITAADKILSATGTFTLIHRADRTEELTATLSPLRPQIDILPLLPKTGMPPKRVLIRARKGMARTTSCQPLVLHRMDGKFTAEADAALRDAGAIIFTAAL